MVATRKREYPPVSDVPRPRKRQLVKFNKESEDELCRSRTSLGKARETEPLHVFRLLDLPGELRNRIYDFALAEPKGLVYQSTGKRGKAFQLCAWRAASQPGLKPSLLEANQLQYVSKQLRAETKGQGLKVNDIGFSHSKRYCLADCLLFLQHLPEYWYKYLGTVVVHGAGVPHNNRSIHLFPNRFPDNQAKNQKFRDQVIEICKANPHITVKWYCESWCIDISFCRTAHTGNIISGAYRNAYAHRLALATGIPQIFDRWESEMERLRNGKPGKFFVDAPNFKVLPWRQSLDRDDLCKRINASMLVCAGHFQADDDEMERWKVKLLDWCDNGV